MKSNTKLTKLIDSKFTKLIHKNFVTFPFVTLCPLCLFRKNTKSEILFFLYIHVDFFADSWLCVFV